jgi:isopenicillin-N N-acyltransferase like protein
LAKWLLSKVRKKRSTNVFHCVPLLFYLYRTNDYPIADSNLEFVREVPNAALYTAGPENARFNVLHLWGTPYEQGFAQGQILKVELREFIAGTWNYLLQAAVDELGDKLPKWAEEMIINQGIEKALDWSIKTTSKFTPQSYYDEIQGLADGSGMDYQLLLRVNMMPELTKASCSFFGAWGEATKESQHTYQLRALDYITDAKAFTDHPQVTIYHPSNSKEGYAHASVAWPGTVGVLTALSEQQLGISEIGVSFADDSFGQGTDDTPPEKVHGQPWMSVLKDVVHYEDSLEGALNRIENSHRTCNLIIGVGDGEESYVNGIEYSGYVAVPYDDQTLLPTNDTWHQIIEDVVYNGMDWDCPTYTEKLMEQLQKYHGTIDAANTIGNILPTVQTGDLHIAVSDLTDLQWFVSFARKTTADPSEPLNAYERQFTQLDMKTLFAMDHPNRK